MSDTSNLTDEKLWHLQHCPLFSGISKQEMEHLRDVTVMVKLEPEDRILADPDDPHAIWFVKEGLLSLTYGDADGKDATVLLLGPGDLFGAMEGAQSLDYSQSMIALKSTVLCRMTQAQMESLLNTHPDIGYRITKFSWRRIARLQQRLAEIMTKPVRVRLATLLMNLSDEYGEDLPEGGRSLGLMITHDDLARLVGSSREMVSKVMGTLRDEGLLRAGRKRIDLLDNDALRAVSEGRVADSVA
ncbi:MAG: Crp/Fnr family transcriptional regulator [Gemmatimonadetes bacterium]|jgi:CRP/FNR family transcriptional regulator, cyclic AMP receptor protein|nr:Crp/Fnr family transcriptional regulator [Gemmatimonadota bacterium]MBT7859274.1 Crp/Fnr family transcriptional regulator [Gemmatimonadota bacterium]